MDRKMNRFDETFGGVKCTLFQNDDSNPEIRGIAVIFHGYCAKGAILAKSLFESCGLSIERNMAAVFPQGPIPIENDKWAKPGDTAWWSYKKERLDDFEFDSRPLLEENEELPGVSEAAEIAKTMLQEIQQKAFPNASVLALSGFSQGAVLATELALDPDVEAAVLGIFSGTLTSKGKWVNRMQRKLPGSMRIVQSHGITDQILNIEQARNLRQSFESTGHAVNYFESNDGHVLHKKAVEGFNKNWRESIRKS
jgi:phospholipase/carboxylesterase